MVTVCEEARAVGVVEEREELGQAVYGDGTTAVAEEGAGESGDCSNGVC